MRDSDITERDKLTIKAQLSLVCIQNKLSQMGTSTPNDERYILVEAREHLQNALNHLTNTKLFLSERELTTYREAIDGLVPLFELMNHAETPRARRNSSDESLHVDYSSSASMYGDMSRFKHPDGEDM